MQETWGARGDAALCATLPSQGSTVEPHTPLRTPTRPPQTPVASVSSALQTPIFGKTQTFQPLEPLSALKKQKYISVRSAENYNRNTLSLLIVYFQATY